MPGKGSPEVLRRLKTRAGLIGLACERRAAFGRAMGRKLRLPDVSACVVRNGRLQQPCRRRNRLYSNLRYVLDAVGRLRLASRVMSNPS